MSIIELTEKSNPDTINIDLMNGYEIAQIINKEDAKVAAAVNKVLDSVGTAIDTIAEAFLAGGRLAYFGAGTSGRLCVLDAAECPPTFSTPPEMVQAFIAGGAPALTQAVEHAEDNSGLALEDLQAFNPQPEDIIVAVSASGNPQYAVTILSEAKKRGIKTIGITSNPNARIKAYSDIFINPDVGPEALTGSSRLKSGTAQKMILNMLTTGAMIRIGKTYKNYMIDVSVSNQKLYDRACRIISEISGIGYNQAEKYLAESHNNVKAACVMAAKKCSLAEAVSLLEANHGILRKIIKDNH